MTAPQLTVYQNGPIAVSGDQLNTFVQTAQTANQLRTLTGATGMQISLQGIAAPNDGLGGDFYWNGAATAADDNLNTIVPNGTVPGAWLRITEEGGGGTSYVLPPASTTVLGGVKVDGTTIKISGSNVISAPGGSIVFPVANYGAVGNGSTDDHLAIQAAINACYAAGGGIVYLPPTGAAYYIATGLLLLNGVALVGAGTRNFRGMDATVAQWTAVGTWIQSGDLTNPAVTIASHGCTIDGVNFIYAQPVPGSTFTPIAYPWTIANGPGGGDFLNLSDIFMVGSYDGINYSFTAGNGGGTGVNFRNLMLGCFHRGIFTDNVNDVMCWDNIHIRNLYYDTTPSVVTYLETNLVGWDCHYTDNPMIKGLEFFQCAYAILLSDGTCLGATHSLFNAILTDVQHFGGFFVAVGTTTVHSSVHITNGLFQTDTTTGAVITSTMFELVSDNVDWFLSNINVFAGGIIAAIGNGVGGRLQIDGMQAQWGATTTGQPGLVAFTGAELALGSRTMAKIGTTAQYISGPGVDEINTPHNWSWCPYSTANQFSITGTGVGVFGGFSLINSFNPIATKKLQGRIFGHINVATAVAGGTASIELTNFPEIVATGISVAVTGLVAFDSGWTDLSSAANPMSAVAASATAGAVIQNADMTVLLR